MADHRAILIGVDGYGFRPLLSAVNDAVAMRDALTSRSTPELAPIFRDEEVILLAAPSIGGSSPERARPATRSEILGVLKTYYDSPEPLGFLLVFFAGHGLTASPDGRVRETLILPSDVTGPEDGRNMICLTELLTLFAERGPRQQVWIIDACRDMSYERRPRGYSIEWGEQAAQGPRSQVAIFAVAQGGTALSSAGGQGRFTGHLLKGLAGTGAAADHIPGLGHCVTAQSLHEYVKRRVAEALEGYDDWTRAIQLPQIYQNNSTVDPLRKLPAPPPRQFSVTVRPTEARPAVSLALEVQYGLPVSGWPPQAPPRVYELRARLLPGMEELGWEEPRPAISAVDLREQESAVIDVGRQAPKPSFPSGPMPLPPTTNERGIGSANTIKQEAAPSSRGLLYMSPAVLTVLAADALARARVRRAEAPWDEYDRKVNTPIKLDAGTWDVMISLGDEVISATRIILNQGELRTVQAVAQITPATAAILPPQQTADGGELLPFSVTPSETIGPMQGTILPTLLPLLALKLFDTQQTILHQFRHLDIPLLGTPKVDDSPLAVAIALDGFREPKVPPILRGSAPTWIERNSRVTLSVAWKREDGDTATIEVSGHRTNIAAPRLPGGVTVIGAISWPDGRLELSVGIFRLPVGTSWDPNASHVPAGRIARALALAVPLFRTGANFADVSEPVLNEIAYAKWIDPTLGALAFHAYDYGLAASHSSPDLAAHWDDRETIRRNLQLRFGNLPDSRIIAALHPDAPSRRDALVALLKDAELGQPVLTASLAHLARAARESGRDDHWAVARFDRIVPGQVFNAIRLP
jgi:hypothetical protein